MDSATPDYVYGGEVIMAQAREPVAAWAGDKSVTLEWTAPQGGTGTLVGT